MILRDYQRDAVEALRSSLGRGFRKPVLVSPTGSGKTCMSMAIVRGAVEKGKRVLFLAPRRELIYQASETFMENGIQHGVIMAGEPRYIHASVQIASFDTLHSRAVRTDRMMMPKADVVICDEAHLSISRTRQEILNHYPIVIGLTATPARGDGRGLGEIYDDLVVAASVRDLMGEGSLVPVRYYAPSEPDLNGLKVTAKGDYIERELGERMDKAELVGDIVQHWFRLAKGKSSVVFCTTRAHSRHIRDEFLKAGIKAEHVDGETPLDERKAIMHRVGTGETTVLCNVYVASYGLDIPRLECAVLARPTRNITLYLQTAGRVLRPFPGKDQAIIIDHSGAVRQHGFVDDVMPWTLDSNADIREAKQKAKEEAKEPKEITCKDCGTVFKSSRICPSCGSQMVPPSAPLPVHEADLVEVGRNDLKVAERRNQDHTTEQKREFFGGLKAYAKQKGFKSGWAAWAFRERYSVWPNAHKDSPMVQPSEEVMGWIKHMNIKRAKRRAA